MRDSARNGKPWPQRQFAPFKIAHKWCVNVITINSSSDLVAISAAWYSEMMEITRKATGIVDWTMDYQTLRETQTRTDWLRSTDH